MARFFFDSSSDAANVLDDTGLELADVETARQHALAGLADLIREEMGRGGTSFAIMVRDRGGREVYAATMAFSERDCR